MGQRFYRRAAALSVAAAASRAAAATYVSTYIPAGSSTWNTPANWSNVPAVTGFPNNGANTWDAIIPGVGVGATEASLSSNITINNFNLSNADLVGAAPDGTTVQANPVSLTVNGNFTNLGVSDRFLKGIVLNLPGTAIVSGGGNFDGDANAAINVSGVLTKDDTGYDQFYNPAVSVSGTVNVMQGALVINNSATQSGTFNVAAGALLQLTGDFTAASLLNVSGEADLLATPGTTAIPGLDNPATGRGFAGTLRVAANATLGFASNGYGGGGYYFTPSSHLSFGSGSTLTVGNYAGTTFADADDLNIATINLNSQTTFRTNSLTAGVVNTTGAETNTIRFETSTAGSGVAIGTLNQAGATIRTGQDDGLPITPVNVATFNLSAGTVGGRIVVSSAANWTGGLVGSTYGDLVISPGATLTISGTGGTVTQGGKLENLGGNLISYNAVIVSGVAGGTGTFQQSTGSTTIHSTFAVGNNGSESNGSAGVAATAYISGGPFYADTILLGNRNGGDGTLALSGSAAVNTVGIQCNDLLVSGGTLTVLQQATPAGQDPELTASLVGGYQRNGTLNVSGGVVSTPYLKLGLTSGHTGTYVQTGGYTVVGTALAVGSDANQASGSGVGVVNISGGVTSTAALRVGSTNGGTGSVAVTGTGFLTVSGSTTVLRGSSLSIANGGRVVLTPHGSIDSPGYTADTISAAAVSGGGTIDVTNHAIDMPGANLAVVNAMVRSGYANGAWNGTGIDSSAAANDTTHTTTVGVILNNDGDGNPIYTPSLVMPPDKKRLGLFQGDDPQVNDVLIAYTYYGDANLDGKVDGSDYSLIDNGYANHMTGFYNGDYNYDGVIDGSDYTLMDNAFNSQAASFGPSAEVAAITSLVAPAAVPEPAAVTLVCLGSAALVLRRRRGAI